MLSKLIKASRYLTGWISWSLLYPMLKSDDWQRRLVDFGLHMAKQHPEKALALKSEIEALLREIGEGIDATPIRQAGGPTIVSDVSGRHAPPKPAVVADGPKGPPPPAPPTARRTGSRDITDLKARLGIKKT